MQFDAIAPHITETHLKIVQVLDGDSLIVQSAFSKKQKEIRLYGLDAPENKRNRKLFEDEKKARLAGSFLILLGKMATEFVLSIAPPNTSITLITEIGLNFDYYKRQLGYIILPDGNCLNELLIAEGFAKPMDEYYCSQLAKYQRLNFAAIQSAKGLYAFTKAF